MSRSKNTNVIDPIVYGALHPADQCCQCCDVCMSHDTWLDELDHLAETYAYEQEIFDEMIFSNRLSSRRVAQ